VPLAAHLGRMPYLTRQLLPVLRLTGAALPEKLLEMSPLTRTRETHCQYGRTYEKEWMMRRK
jgi:hypothetical protein